MDPIIIVPVALAVAWAASRKKKTTKPKASAPELPPLHDDPFDGPGGVEPWRPGGPDLPKPPQNEGPVGPKPFPGPSGGPKAPELGDPSPTEIHPGTTAKDIEAHEHAAHGLFISSDCLTIYEGEHWYKEVFLPQARELVNGNPQAFHHPVGVMYELLVMPIPEDGFWPTPAQDCVAAWTDIALSDYTPLGTLSGYVTPRSDPGDTYVEYYYWFSHEYAQLHAFLANLQWRLWQEHEFAPIFGADWPGDEYWDDLEFDPTGT